eukprot:COSAG03_NODE_11462_length_591_cov_1.138211_1_plen_72_part_00
MHSATPKVMETIQQLTASAVRTNKHKLHHISNAASYSPAFSALHALASAAATSFWWQAVVAADQASRHVDI